MFLLKIIKNVSCLNSYLVCNELQNLETKMRNSKKNGLRMVVVLKQLGSVCVPFRLMSRFITLIFFQQKEERT